jgi:LacI family transcriptional regulator
VMGFANESFDEHITPSLSSIDQQTKKMGEAAFKLLMDLIADPEAVDVLSKSIILPPNPVYRESSRRG